MIAEEGPVVVSTVIAVYAGKSAERNLQVARRVGTWGFKQHQPDYDRIRPGDLLLIATGFTGGSPRVQAEEWRRHTVGSIEIARVTREVYEDRSPLWPDEQTGEASYPYRFGFELVGRATSVILDSEGPLGEQVADAFRRSAIAQGRGYVMDDPVGFKLDPEVNPAPSTPTPRDTTPPDPASEEPVEVASIQDLVLSFEEEVERSGLRFPPLLPARFLCGLLAKPFVVLTGLSGSGKTQLALAFGRWIGEERTCVSAVRPDWTGAEALFGYENLLLPPVDGRAAWTVPRELQFMLRAADDPEEPYLLVLDEMNLAHVERYFADVLSGMESGAEVLPNLVEDEDDIWRISAEGPDRLPFPRNLLVVGTVNIDETTYQFSPKVLDRSTSIEFRVATDVLAAERPQPDRIRPATEAQRRAIVTPPDRSDDDHVGPELVKDIEGLHEMLASHGREFGHRSYQEMRRYAGLLGEAKPDLGHEQILDHLVAQKVLPRIHGSARELAGVVSDLADLAGVDRAPDDDRPVLRVSAEKLRRMQGELEATHFTAF